MRASAATASDEAPEVDPGPQAGPAPASTPAQRRAVRVTAQGSVLTANVQLFPASVLPGLLWVLTPPHTRKLLNVLQVQVSFND